METNLSISLNFSDLLDGLFRRVDDSISNAVDKAKNAIVESEVETLGELGLALNQVKNFYRDQLDYTIEKVSKEANEAFNRLNTLMQRFENEVDRNLQEIEAQAQQIVNSLPFTKKQPQVTTLKPRFFVITDVALASLVTFKGNFPSSATPGFEASFIVKDKKCTLVDNSLTGSLTFKVPHSVFQKDDKEKYSSAEGTLQVPWDESVWWPWTSEAKSIYKVSLGALPQLAGKGFVEYISHTNVRDSQHKKSDTYSVNGNSYYPHDGNPVIHIYPSPGWTIDVTKQPRLDVHHQHGKHSQNIKAVTPQEILVGVWVYGRAGKDIGIVSFEVEFEEYRDRVEGHKRTEMFETNWKDSKLLEPLEGENISKVVFDDYKGTHQEYGAPDLKSGILKIAAEGNFKWKIWAEAPNEVALTNEEISPKLKKDLQTLQRLAHLQYLANLPKELRILPLELHPVDVKLDEREKEVESKEKDNEEVTVVLEKELSLQEPDKISEEESKEK